MTSGKQGVIDVVFDGAVHDNVPQTAHVERIVRDVLVGEHVSWTHIGIILTDHATVTELNRLWLNHEHDTDVLSFVIEESDNGLEGEVYVDTQTAAERHEEFGTSYEMEVLRYVIHGVLHLAGLDDQTAEEQRFMTRLENRYLECNRPVMPSSGAAQSEVEHTPESE